jgi:hypothetical protein
MGMFDPPLTLGADANLVAGLPDGLSVSGDQCAWARPAGDPRVQVMDLAEDATGRRVVAALGPFGSANGLQVSDDGGRFWRAGVRRERFFIETVEVAPSDPERVYVSGYETGGIAVLLRSDDGGHSLREVTRDFLGGVDVYVAAVDPRNPDVVWVRSNRDRGTLLLRSDEGGARLRRVAETRERMVGFALSDDGRTVWIGSQDRAEGIQRAVAGGPFARVRATVTVTCLRQHAGVLYVCTDEAVDGFALGCSLDGGDRIDPILSLRDLAGPSLCPAGTSVADRCGPLWPAQRTMLLALDAGPLTRVYHEERPEPPPDTITLDVPAEAPSADLPAEALGDTPGETPRDTLADGPGETPEDALGDALEDAGGEPPLDSASPLDVANDASADVSDAPTEAPSRDSSAPDGAPDEPRMDLPLTPDASTDAPAADRGPAERPGTCGCATPGTVRGAWPSVLALALAFSVRPQGRRRWRSLRLWGR